MLTGLLHCENIDQYADAELLVDSGQCYPVQYVQYFFHWDLRTPEACPLSLGFSITISIRGTSPSKLYVSLCNLP